MKERSFDGMIAYFNRRVSEMDIDQDYKKGKVLHMLRDKCVRVYL